MNNQCRNGASEGAHVINFDFFAVIRERNCSKFLFDDGVDFNNIQNLRAAQPNLINCFSDFSNISIRETRCPNNRNFFG